MHWPGYYYFEPVRGQVKVDLIDSLERGDL